jgi:hypothetical protein
MDTQILLFIWIVLAVLIFLLGIMNAVSIMTLESRMNQLDSKSNKSVMMIIKDNLYIFAPILLASLVSPLFIIFINDNTLKYIVVSTIIIISITIGIVIKKEKSGK